MFNKIKNQKIFKTLVVVLLLSIMPTICGLCVYANKVAHINYTGETYANGHIKDVITLDGEVAYCIEIGKTFRDKVSDLYNLLIGGESLDEYTSSTIIPTYTTGGKNKWLGWGYWSENDDHTDSIAGSKALSPSGGTLGTHSDTNISNAKDLYTVYFKNISKYWSTGQIKALALLEYYCEDTGVPHDVHQVFVWAIQNGKMTTVGSLSSFRVVFTDAIAMDNYAKSFLSGAELSKYKAIVWKLSNLQQVPSFASISTYGIALNDKLIHLKWDANANAYTATVADENGMLKYFDMTASSIPGCTITQNTAEGTITISTPTPFTGVKTNARSASNSHSTLVPSETKFGYITFWRWALEGKHASFQYSYQKEISGHKYQAYGTGWQCKWHCTTSGSANHCSGRKNTHSCSVGGCGYCSDPCCSTYHHYGGLNVHVHNHTTDACYHEDHCTCRSVGVHTSKYDSHCTVTYDCTKQHIKTYRNMTPEGTYRDWQDVELEDPGDYLLDPPIPFIAVKCDIEEHPAETDVEILLVADNSSYNNKTYTYDDGSTIKYTDHIRPNEKYNGEYNIEMVQEHCK